MLDTNGQVEPLSQDTLSEVLRGVRLRGAVFYHVEGVASWAAESPLASAIAERIMPGIGHVMSYHAVTQGACWGAVVGGEPVRLEQGDVIVFPRGDPHVLSSAPGMRAPVDLRAFDVPRPQQLPFHLHRQGGAVAQSELNGGDGCTTLLCGYFGCHSRPFNPLLDCLPPLLHVRARDDDDGWIAQFVRFAVLESRNKRPGGEALLERLSETMFVALVRRYLDTLPEDQPGWLAGIRDRYVGRALALLHERPADAWTVDRLSDRVGLSRSALHERFTQFTNHSPMQYLTRWRMQCASNLLRHSGGTIASIALEVGYESEAAFSRAFRRATGEPPAAWRRRQTDFHANAG